MPINEHYHQFSSPLHERRNGILDTCSDLRRLRHGKLEGYGHLPPGFVIFFFFGNSHKDYYHRSLVGTMVDEKLFEFLVGKFLPEVSDHLKKLDVPLELASQPWFLCLFVGYVPIEVKIFHPK